MPNGFGMPSSFVFATDIGPSYAPSGLEYIPDISLPQQLQPTPYMPTLATTMPTAPSGLGYIPDISLPQELQPTTPSGLSYIPDVSLPPQLQPPAIEQPAGYGPLELFGDVAKGAWDIASGAAQTLWDAGQFILENLEVGVGIATGAATGAAGIAAQKKQAEAQKTAAEAQKIAAEAYKLKTLAAQMVEPVTVPEVAQPLTYITPETGEAKPNYLLYIGLAILAIFLLGKKL